VYVSSRRAAPPYLDKPRRFNAEAWIAIAIFLTVATIPAIAKFQTDPSESRSSTFNQVLWSAMYLAAGVRLIQMGVLRQVLIKLAPIWAFCFLMLLSAVWSVDSWTTVTNSIELLGTTVVGCYLATRFTQPDFLRILALTFSLVAALSFMFIFAFPGRAHEFYGSGPWVGMFPEKNALGASMALGLLSLGALIRSSSGGIRIYALIASVACGVLLWGTNSMTAMLDLAAVLAVIAALSMWTSKRLGIFGKILCIGLAIIAIIAYVSDFSVHTVLSLVGRSDNLSGRGEMWPYVQAAIADRSMLGYGYNAFFHSDIARGYFSTVVAFGNAPPYHAHNSFYQITIDGGFVALLVFCVALLFGTWNAIKYCLSGSGMAAFWPLQIILFLLIGSADETYFGNPNSFEWILFMAACIYPIRASIVRSSE
jgi:exopolysaccharide production protein ExoQ